MSENAVRRSPLAVSDALSLGQAGRPCDVVTFDFWNTLMWEMPGSLREHRLSSWIDGFAEIGIDVNRSIIERAHDLAHAAYVHAWEAGRQFTVESAVSLMAATIGGDEHATIGEILTQGFNQGGLDASVLPTEGVHECLCTLREAGIRLGVVCDIGLTPSVIVRRLLDRHGLLHLLDHTTFSDEIGHYKPSRRVFEHALVHLGSVDPARAVHVGDRRRTDVAGAHALGMMTVRYNGVYEDDSEWPEADMVVGDLRELDRRIGLRP